MMSIDNSYDEGRTITLEARVSAATLASIIRHYEKKGYHIRNRSEAISHIVETHFSNLLIRYGEDNIERFNDDDAITFLISRLGTRLLKRKKTAMQFARDESKTVSRDIAVSNKVGSVWDNPDFVIPDDGSPIPEEQMKRITEKPDLSGMPPIITKEEDNNE